MLVVESIALLSILHLFRATLEFDIMALLWPTTPIQSTGGFKECPQTLNGDLSGTNDRSEAFYLSRMPRLHHCIGVCGAWGWHVPSGRGVDGGVWRRPHSLAPATQAPFRIDKAPRLNKVSLVDWTRPEWSFYLPRHPDTAFSPSTSRPKNPYSGL
jgi:hypothetical protein